MERLIYQIKSDAMEPNLQTGDNVVCEKADISCFFNGLYLIAFESGIEAVRMVNDKGDNIELKCHKDNSTQIIPKSYIKDFFKVIALVRRYDY